MTKMQKILSLFKLTESSVPTKTNKISNYQFSYHDIAEYDMKPFDLKHPFISDGHFICISLNDYNLAKAYEYLNETNALIIPFANYFDNVKLPTKISTEYFNQHNLPLSHLRLTPYTSSNRKSKYPFYLWLNYFSEYGSEYLYKIYFNSNGELAKSDLSFHAPSPKRISYQIQIRNDGHKNYVRRIDKTLYEKPYGTYTTYIYHEQ